MSTSNDKDTSTQPTKKMKLSETESVPKRGKKDRRTNKRRKSNKKKSEPKENKWIPSTSNLWVNENERTNEFFERYYDLQFSLLPNWNTERELFFKSLRTQLPQTWRINESLDPVEHEAIRKRIEEFAKEIAELEIEVEDTTTSTQQQQPSESSTTTGEQTSAPSEQAQEKKMIKVKIDPPAPLSWYPNNDGTESAQNFPTRNSGWTFAVSKALFRKDATLQQLRQFLMVETDNGTISRQESVSMLPPIFFYNHMRPDDRVLDMCAAPGSKTAQLMEMLYASSKKYQQPITGYVVGNDNDMKRAYLLVHQMQRLANIFPHIMITNHDATQFPLLSVAGRKKRFTKVLADVMCSGDGTLRKSPDLWKRWRPNLAWSLHDMQLRCAYRAYQVLETGGMLVYSTCSINPIEDEAVVAELIRRTNYGLELVDASKELPNLNFSPGMTNWYVTDSKAEIITREKYDEFNKLSVEEQEKYRGKVSPKITPSFYPPTEEEIKKMNLHYCMRLLPHRMDTGGFFVAVFRKVSDPVQERQKLKEEKKGEFIKVFHGRSSEDERIVSVPERVYTKIYDYYGIDKSIVPPERLIIRIADFSKKYKSDEFTLDKIQDEDCKKIYYISPGVSEIVAANAEQQRWKIVNLGTVVFENKIADFMPKECSFRLTQEFVSLFTHAIRKDRVLTLNKQDFVRFITQQTTQPEEIKDEQVREQIKNLAGGACVVTYGQPESDTRQVTINICALKTHFNLMRHCPKDLIKSVLHQVDPEIKYEEEKPKQQQNKQQKAE